MKHTDQEIERASKRFEQWAATVDPDAAEFQDTTDLAAIARAADAVDASEQQLREAVETARRNGRSWNRIAVALGVSRQAARQRFADKVTGSRR